MGPYPQHNNNFGSDTTSGPSGIWSTCPFDEVVAGYHPGWAHHWDFVRFKSYTSFTTEAYAEDGLMIFGSTGATAAITSDPTQGTGTVANNAFGVIALGSDGDDEGAALRQSQAPFKLSGPNATATARSGKFWLEARVKVSSIADTIADCFVGLMEDTAATAAVPCTATAGTLADKNLVGFHRLGTDGDQWDCKYKADGQTVVTAKADAFTIVADTYTKLALVYDPGNYSIRWFANGAQLAAYTVLATQGNPFPNDVLLGAVLGITNAAGSITPTLSCDWLRVCQIPLVV